MISSFNLTKLTSLLKDFYTLTQIRITVFDDSFKELTAYPEHISPVCQIIRSDVGAYEKCKLCDKHACETASGRHTSYTYQCHAGLTESIMPLYLGNIVIGYLLFGHVFSYASHEYGWNKIKELCSDYKLDLNKLKEACLEQPLISEDYITSASHILRAVASFLCLERMAIISQKELPIQIDEFISDHFTEDITVASICEHFQIGKTHLYEISNQCYGIGIAEHIRTLRINKAKELLTERSDLYIDEVASMCGFNDYNYFITIFKRLVGTTPQKYKLNIRNEYKSRQTPD